MWTNISLVYWYVSFDHALVLHILVVLKIKKVLRHKIFCGLMAAGLDFAISHCSLVQTSYLILKRLFQKWCCFFKIHLYNYQNPRTSMFFSLVHVNQIGDSIAVWSHPHFLCQTQLIYNYGITEPIHPHPSAQPGGTWQAFMAWVPTGSAMQNPEPWSLWRNKKGANGQGKGGGLVGGNKNWT